MKLDKKLILEELVDETTNEPSEVTELTEDEINNFNSGLTSDVLNRCLDLFNFLEGSKNDTNVKPEVFSILNDISGDIALCIGKLQETLKLSTGDENKDLINQGQDDAQEIIKEE